MDILKTTGIVLSSKKIGEADIASIIYTRDYGKKNFIFKGLKKSRRRSRAAAEPGAVTDLVYYFREERESYIVNEFSVQEHFASRMNSLEKIFSLYYILETVDRTCGYHISDSTIYDLTIGAFSALAETPYPHHLSLFFIIHLLRLQGILADPGACRVCGKRDMKRFILDIADLKTICAGCLTESGKANSHAILLDSSARSYVAASLSSKFSAVDHKGFSEKTIKDLLFTLSLFVENYFHTEIKSKSFILSSH